MEKYPRITIRLPDALLSGLRHYAEEHGISVSEAVKRAILAMLEP